MVAWPGEGDQKQRVELESATLGSHPFQVGWDQKGFIPAVRELVSLVECQIYVSYLLKYRLIAEVS